jgi:hypothetical protein
MSDLPALFLLAAEPAPAGGAETGEALLATAGVSVITAVMMAIVLGHRSGRLPQVQRAADFVERRTGIPGFASLPLLFVLASLGVAVFGMYWDVAIHIDEGRDAGPLANPAHYFILLGLLGIFFAGILAMFLPRSEQASAASVKLGRNWHAPLGGVLIVASSSFALAAFPLDDIWHRLFGQDVTLWGPTHLLLIGGAGLATVGSLILLGEGVRSREHAEAREQAGAHAKPGWLLLHQATLAGAFLVALSTFQAEYDFGVPQFNLLFHPIFLMLAAGMGLVSARLMIGRGGALLAVAGYLAIRGVLSIFVGPITDHTTLHLPLYIVEALVVEAVALRGPLKRPLAFGALAGLGIGTIGLAAEWAWSHVSWSIPWTSSMVPEAVIAGMVSGVAGGVMGGFIGRSLRAPTLPTEAEPRWLAPAAALVAMAVVGFTLPTTAGDGASADVTLREVTPAPKRTVQADVQLDPPDVAEGAKWFTVTAWQGGGSGVNNLEKVGEGRYRSTEPIPVHGTWKSMLRLHKGRDIVGVPIFLPRDPAIPVGEVPAAERFTRSFRLDKENLQREQKDDVSAVLVTGAYLTVLLIGLGLFLALGWGLARFATHTGPTPTARHTDLERTTA